MKLFQLLLLAGLLISAVGLPPTCCGQDAALDEDPSVTQGREALQGRTYFPFYDPKTDDVRRVDVKENNPSTDPNSKAKWAAQPGTTPARGAIGGGRSSLGPIFQVIGLSILTLLIVAVAILLVKTFLQGEQTQTQGTQFVDTHKDIDRVEDLPFQLKRVTGDFLAEARRLYEAGQYSEAVIYLFSYQLVALDKRHVIRLAKGKTNRQYLREARSREPLKQMLQGTMISFEDVFFGHHELSRERFEESWHRLDDFHAQLEKVELAAA
ncbi:DUF4129 domain-containing protein [Anatilimnocola sp. NA78]|uniref:DUF4129 domain-containing protein n=1 Tax=Anatilimnocola sp. NA78 TaxID=3415683 RepID=UPI003CE50C4D